MSCLVQHCEMKNVVTFLLGLPSVFCRPSESGSWILKWPSNHYFHSMQFIDNKICFAGIIFNDDTDTSATRVPQPCCSPSLRRGHPSQSSLCSHGQGLQPTPPSGSHHKQQVWLKITILQLYSYIESI